ncbi:MAG: EamA family transporter [Steroidobacteraceae bacterium]|nr:EamA family transporter [Steroidobacteraceae bacterium]
MTAPELTRSQLWQLVLINGIWGFNIVAIKLSVDRFPPVFLSFLRFLIVGLAVLPWLRRRWRSRDSWACRSRRCCSETASTGAWSWVA